MSWRDLSRGLAALILGLLAILEGLTIAAACLLLDPSYVPITLWAFWTLRTLGYGLSSRWIMRGDRRGWWLGLALMAIVLALAVPWGHDDFTMQQGHRRQWCLLCTVLLLTTLRRQDPAPG